MPLAPGQVPAPSQPVVARPETVTAPAAATAAALAPAEGLIQVDIDLIDPSPFQPRSRFREEALDELSRSIRASGIVQPLVVRRMGQRYQLIAGERRWRAAQRAAIATVPAVVRDVRDEMALEMTLVENLQREDLNPIEQARAFERLTKEFHLTQEQVAERTGKDRATIANSVRLLRLERPIQDLLEEGRLSAGHGRALLAIAEAQDRLVLARRIARGGMTVRQVERSAARIARKKPEAPPAVLDPNTKWAVDELQRKFGTKVAIHPLRPGRPGQLVFEYYDASDLNRLYDQLMRE
ncbi:MAG TPA: ParB/RepB/Spo0J family partition protein [Candidatus Acidoferrales bacterium]|nr:ParB/RepB/Spo0J family partition protein [Candidatus Acidoferrales bacterium]